MRYVASIERLLVARGRSSGRPGRRPDGGGRGTMTVAVWGAILAALLCAATSAGQPTAEVDLRSAEPGPEAAAAYALLEKGQKQEGCDVFIAQLRAGTQDPWSFRGAVTCAVEVEGYRPAVVKLLAKLPAGSSLVLFARGYLHYLEGEYPQAEELLRQAVALKPDFVLALNALGAAIQMGGDHAAAIPVIEEALRLAPQLEMAQWNLERARLYAGVFDRLLALLTAIPERWQSIREPLVPVSGKNPAHVAGGASGEEVRLATAFITRLALSSLGDRQKLMESWLEGHDPTEVDLWVPGLLAETVQTRSYAEAALIVEAWLQWAEVLGRRDGLLLAAGFVINLMTMQLGLDSTLPASRAWAELPPSPGLEIGQATALRAHATLLFLLGDSDASLSAYRQARQLFQAVGNRLGQGNAFKGEADVLFRLGDNDASLSAYRQARQLFQAVGDQLGQGNTWRGEADVLFLLGDNERSLSAYHEARQLFQAVGDQLGQGNTWLGEADVLFRLGDNDASLSAYRQARQFFQAVGNHHGKGNTWYGEAEVLFRLGDNERSLSAYHEARQLFQAIGDQIGQGNTWLGEADVLFRLGDTERGSSAYHQAHQLFQAGEDQLGQGNSWLGKAEVLFGLGENEGALSAYRQARQLFQAVGEQLGQGSTLKGEAEVLFGLGENEGALSAYRQARELFQAVGSQHGQGNTWDGEADVLSQLGENEGALSAYRQARELFQAVGAPLGQGNTWFGEARVLLRRGENVAAADAAGTAVTLFDNLVAVPNLRNALLVEAGARYLLNQYEEAIDLALEAIRLHESWRTTTIIEEHRTESDFDIWGAYDILVPILVNDDRFPEALTFAEEARSRVLLDLLATGHSDDRDNSPLNLLGERQTLEFELATTEEALNKATGPEDRWDLQIKRWRLDRALRRNRYESTAVRQSSLQAQEPMDAAAIRELAEEAGPLVVYYAADAEVFAFVVLPERSDIPVERIDLAWNDLGAAVEDFAYDLSNPLYEPGARRSARKLWDRIVAPVEKHLPGSGALTVIPHGPLHELPFEALVDPDGNFLFERWRVSVAPSVSALAFARGRHRPAQPSDSFVGFSSGQGLSLPDVEIGEIAPFFGGDKVTFRSTEAYFENYERLAPGADHLFIASRGVHVPGSRTETYVEILPTPGVHDSRLHAVEIAATEIQAQLVVLAACDTGRGEAFLSDERLDLTRAFLIAGASSVLATRWKVPESRATSRFLIDFYRAYRTGGPDGRGMRKDEALNEARRQSVARGDPAQLWAAWVLVGDPR